MAAAVCPAPVIHRDVTLVFTDIAGSTSLLAELGEERYLRMLRRHNATIRSTTRHHGGSPVKFLGDGWMLAFPGPEGAVECAVACQRGLEATGDDDPEGAVRVRIGVHTGAALEDGDELIGRDVILASRLVREAAPGEIVASDAVRGALQGDPRFGDPRLMALRGLGLHRVFRVST